MSERSDLTEEGKKDLLQCLKQYEAAGTGCIDTKTFPKALAIAGITATTEQMEEIIALFDTNGDGTLQIKELVDNWEQLLQHSISGEELLDAFKLFDANKDGYVSMSELKFVLTQAGDKWSQREATAFITDLLKEFDTDRDGRFAYPEFVEMFRKNRFPFEKPQLPKLHINEDFEIRKKE